MAVIGNFEPTKDGGWTGTIQTMTINVKARLVPNDNRDNDHAPAFRIFAGRSELGAAWRQRSNGEPPRDYLSIKLDDPALPEGHLGGAVRERGWQRGATRLEPP